ncbi:MAG TPA: glycosyltransferase [Micromonosporaceae bacterium]|nr:glycosyltransferase [Micromonosporaceae bacterium]
MPRLVIVSTYPPRRCGLAAFAEALRVALLAPGTQRSVQVCAVDRDGLTYGPEVVEVIRQDCPDDYRRAGRALAADGVDLVVIQHEYGIFGGPDGSFVLELADELRYWAVPYVVTLHTVLSAPSPGQAATLSALCEGAARVTGFTETARRLAARTGVAEPARFTVVPHGAPAVLRTAGARQVGSTVRTVLDELGDARVLSTFGLIGPGKGLETAIAGLPAVVARHPSVRYLIAGATHPEVVRHGRETYRDGLAALARDLGVAEHVLFLDAFLTEDELAALLQRTDIYLTPYRSPDQICSGALTFALAAGCPVVSTAYRYAIDMVTPDRGAPRGLVVACDDVEGFAGAIDTLLADPGRLAAARNAAWELGATLTWQSVAARFAQVFQDATQATAPIGAAPRHGAFSLGHLDRLTDDVGIIQFARGAEPDPGSGYCIDDVARLAIVAAGVSALPLPANPRTGPWLAAALRLMEAALRPEGMHNMLGYEGLWRDRPHLGDHVGRAGWALGRLAGRDGPPAIRRQARRLLDAVLPLVPLLTAPRSRAYAILGLSRLDDADPDELAALRDAAGALYTAVRHDPGWHWYEPTLTYDNARLPQALLAAGSRLGDPAMVQIGLSTLDWYLTRVGLGASGAMLRVVGNEWRHVDGNPRATDGRDGDEQPLDAAATVEALVEAWQVTADPRYAVLAGRAFAWFLGRNRTGVALYDPSTGGCRDGLSATGANANQGAESTLAYYQALLAMVACGLGDLAGRPRVTRSALIRMRAPVRGSGVLRR